MNVCLGTHIRLYSEFCKIVIHLLDYFPPWLLNGWSIFIMLCMCVYWQTFFQDMACPLASSRQHTRYDRAFNERWDMKCDAQSRELNRSNAPQNLSYSLGMNKTNNIIKNYEKCVKQWPNMLISDLTCCIVA